MEEQYIKEKKLLYQYLGEDIVEIFKEAKVIIAGGTVTSLFCNKPINDIDFYIKNNKGVPELIKNLASKTSSMYKSKKAILFPCSDELKLQLVYFKIFKDAYEIFESFDFTCCMGAFDFETELFILREGFLKDNSQRILRFNRETDYPYISLLRVRKYEEKGYKISKPEMIKIILACSDIKIESWEDVLNQMGGMYGMNIEEFFDITKPFSKEEIFTQIEENILNSHLFDKDIKFKGFSGAACIDELVDDILSKEKYYVKLSDNRYKKINNKLELIGEFKEDKDVVGSCIVSIIDWQSKRLPKNIAYKFVKPVDNGIYCSFYDNSFLYKIGTVTNNQKEELYFSDISELKNATYSTNKESVVIECILFDILTDTIHEHNSMIRAKNCLPIREFPYNKKEIIEDVDFFEDLPF